MDGGGGAADRDEDAPLNNLVLSVRGAPFPSDLPSSLASLLADTS